MLKKMIINGLFNQFDYEIDLKPEGLTILTGPNGYGKTTILKILYALAIKNLAYFFQFPFKTIILSFENNEISLSKPSQKIIEINMKDQVRLSYNIRQISENMTRLFGELQYREIDDHYWLDRNTNNRYATEELFTFLSDNNPEFQKQAIERMFGEMPDIGYVYLIKDQRLIRKATPNRRWGVSYFEGEIYENFSNTIEECAKELSQTMQVVLAQASKIGQELDSSFPRRLFEATTLVGEAEFERRYDAIKEKQKALRLYGLSATKEDSQTSFKEENAKALHVYLNDTEQKLSVFDELLQKLHIFSTTLNDRQFVFKQLHISPDFGFRFTTAHDQELPLANLSSGEQQEVVLLYELLFRVQSNTLVLIDEPEISLHVAWQKEVLDDLLKIIKLQKITVITATHSPQIIGSHWDAVVDLWELSKGAEA